MTVHRPKGMTLSIASLLVLLVAWPGIAGAQPPPPQTVCILDFNRLGDDASMDWLQRGLSDMMIGTMNRLSPYQVVEREHLRDILREHGLVASGLVDMDTAIRQARLAKAELLLLGSFARQQDQLIVQVRLVRITDQQILAQAVWTDRHTNVLAAPQALSEALLTRLGTPVDPAQPGGIEKAIPPLAQGEAIVLFAERETETPRFLVERKGEGMAVTVEMRLLGRLAADPLAQKIFLDLFEVLNNEQQSMGGNDR